MAFKMKSGNAPAFKQIGSATASEEPVVGNNSGDSPLPFWKGLKNAVKNVARNNPISMATRAIKGDDVIKIDGMNEEDGGDCDCGEEGISGQSMGAIGGAGIFGGGDRAMSEEHWKKIQNKESKAS